MVLDQSLLAANDTQLDRLVGLGMLIVATTVFLYYTIWTLLMVRSSRKFANPACNLSLLIALSAFRRRFAPDSIAISTTSLGNTHTCHTVAAR